LTVSSPLVLAQIVATQQQIRHAAKIPSTAHSHPRRFGSGSAGGM
jgi:hypothetical protein